MNSLQIHRRSQLTLAFFAAAIFLTLATITIQLQVPTGTQVEDIHVSLDNGVTHVGVPTSSTTAPGSSTAISQPQSQTTVPQSATI